MLSSTSPEVVEFLKRWHTAARVEFAKRHSSKWAEETYDTNHAKHATDRRKYIACDEGPHDRDGGGRSGVYLIERETGRVFTIKGYGVPNKFADMMGEMFPTEAVQS
jgi:hypothetical protein